MMKWVVGIVLVAAALFAIRLFTIGNRLRNTDCPKCKAKDSLFVEKAQDGKLVTRCEKCGHVPEKAS